MSEINPNNDEWFNFFQIVEVKTANMADFLGSSKRTMDPAKGKVLESKNDFYFSLKQDHTTLCTISKQDLQVEIPLEEITLESLTKLFFDPDKGSTVRSRFMAQDYFTLAWVKLTKALANAYAQSLWSIRSKSLLTQEFLKSSLLFPTDTFSNQKCF